jgi:hypothetical protein
VAGLGEHNVAIDYSKNLSLASLYGQFISCFCKDWPKLSSASDGAWKRERMLSILNYAGLHIHSIFGEDEERLPTWAPAFHLVNQYTIQFWPRLTDASKKPQELEDAAEATFSLADLELSISGISIDRIAYIALESTNTMLEKESLLKSYSEIIAEQLIFGLRFR